MRVGVQEHSMCSPSGPRSCGHLAPARGQRLFAAVAAPCARGRPPTRRSLRAGRRAPLNGPTRPNGRKRTRGPAAGHWELRWTRGFQPYLRMRVLSDPAKIRRKKLSSDGRAGRSGESCLDAMVTLPFSPGTAGQNMRRTGRRRTSRFTRVVARTHCTAS